jgi:hypothetical protein
MSRRPDQVSNWKMSTSLLDRHTRRLLLLLRVKPSEELLLLCTWTGGQKIKSGSVLSSAAPEEVSPLSSLLIRIPLSVFQSWWTDTEVSAC